MCYSEILDLFALKGNRILHWNPRMPSGISCMIHAMHLVAVQYLDNVDFSHWKVSHYAEQILNIHGLVETPCNLIDEALHKAYHPRYIQKLMYSGEKWCHGIKISAHCYPSWFSCMNAFMLL